VPPPEGKAVLIDPRLEDPMSLLFLDLLGTFAYRPRLGLAASDVNRATYTTEVLGLNRDVVRRGRQGAFRHYLALLEKYVAERSRGGGVFELAEVERSIRVMTGHPTVWAEIVRQRDSLGDRVVSLFEKAPEAAGW
jgi:hypothetical protein